VHATKQGFPLPCQEGRIPRRFVPAQMKANRVTPRLIVAGVMAVLVLWSLPGLAQTGRVEGIVRVGTGQEDTGGASVKLYDPQLGLVDSTMTDTQGRFYFQGVRPGEYTLVTSKAGYYTKEQDLKVQIAMPGQYVTVFLTAEGPFVKGKGGSEVSAAELALPPKVRDEFTKGKNELKKKKYVAALRHLKAVTDAQPQFALGFEVLGVAYYRSGDSAKAEAAFHKALQLDSKRAESYIQLGLLSYEQQHYADSERYLETGLRLEPESWFGHYQLGLTYFALENYKDSERELRKAQELDPSFAEVHVRLGNVYLRLQNASKALAEFEHYLHMDPRGRFAARTRQVVDEMRNSGVAPQS
jgi:Flp pilus assembly protein TadD